MELLRDRSEEFFFFSSRRRHTRFDCDWSSDVCSSDLIEESEALDLSNATATHAYLSEMLPGVMVGLLHSRMPTAEKKAVMELFSADRKSTRLNSSHSQISYAVFCLKKKNNRISANRRRTAVLSRQ